MNPSQPDPTLPPTTAPITPAPVADPTPPKPPVVASTNIPMGHAEESNINYKDTPVAPNTVSDAPITTSMPEAPPVPASITSPNAKTAAELATLGLDAAKIAELLQMPENQRKIPTVNLLAHHDDEEPVPPVPVAPLPTTAPPVAVAKSKNSPALAIIGAVLALLVVGGATGYYFLIAKPSKPIVAVSPTPSPSPVATPTPSATPVATPTPTPSATPAPDTVSVPTTTPTASNPQNVTVRAASGLWLRSTPTSVNQNNVIGWMPNGATVSVDQIGDFWWHGTYTDKAGKVKVGYFASKYTQ